ncbi:uncharacterized protein LOC133348629 isoform X2 [Lethenteron reissneri]|uniref:uncharacterized protein LOC133348629 isoform X2 n=1 Tax=Lethenteron reissneri TaxID=7753 RepID=UPI002AB7AA2D|nr:uncharacterized protein LOC133348629 isoform X2 [Lethenteron reissneri]
MARSARGHVDDSSGKVLGRRWRRAAGGNTGGAAAATAADFSDDDATDGGGSEDASDVSRDGKFSGRCGEVKGGVGFFDGDSEDFKNGDDADRDAAGRGRDRGYSGDGDAVRMGKDGDGGDTTVQSVSARDHQLHSECRFPAQVHALSPARALLSGLSGISRTVCSPSPDPEPSDSSSEDDGTRARHARYLHKSKSTGKRTWPSARSQEFGPGFVFKAGAAVGVSRFPPASPEVPEFPSTSRGHVPDVARAVLALADTTSGRAEAPFGDVNGGATPTSVEIHGAPSTEQSITGMSSYGRGGGGARRRHDVGPAASAAEDSILTLVGLQGPSPARSDSRDLATASNGFQVQTVSGEDGGAGSTRDRLRRQVQHLCAFLEVSGQAEELVLRRSGLDGELFSPLSVAIARTPSFLSTLNLNLNVLRANGARMLATALPTQSRLKTLLLFGNQMCDDGVCAVLKSLTSAIALGGRLLELDVGGNCLTGVALRDIASYLRANTALTELGLSRNPDALPEDWAPLFEVLALPGCGLARLALEENRLGERGASLAARALASNLQPAGVGGRGERPRQPGCPHRGAVGSAGQHGQPARLPVPGRLCGTE